MKKRTIIGLAIMLLSALVCVGIIICMKSQLAGDKVMVYLSGQLYGEYDLNKNQTVTIESSLGYNILVIKDGVAAVIEADCPEQICVQSMAISKECPGIIVCLPHELVISLHD